MKFTIRVSKIGYEKDVENLTAPEVFINKITSSIFEIFDNELKNNLWPIGEIYPPILISVIVSNIILNFFSTFNREDNEIDRLNSLNYLLETINSLCISSLKSINEIKEH